MDWRWILVVEDDDLIRESITEFLQDSGYHAIGAADGRDALDRLGGSPSLPCLIVLDLMMPVMDGAAFRHAQLANPRLCTIPVVVVSAYKDVAEQSRDLDAAAYLKKPLKLADLLRLIEERCTGQGAHA